MRNLRKRNLKKISLIVFVFLFCLFICLYNYTSYKNINVYEMLSNQGPVYTLKYMINSDKYEYTYEKAWVLYRNTNMADSRKIIYRIIKNKNNKKLIADCHYLLGHINFFEDNYLEGIKEFSLANNIYTELSKYENIFYSYLGIAICLIDIDQLDNAEEALSLAIKNFKLATRSGVVTMDRSQLVRNELIGLAQYYLVRKRYELQNKNYEKALVNAINCVDFYKAIDSKNGEADALIDVGYLNMILGNYIEGLKYTFEAQNIIFDLNDQRKYVYNLINLIIYFKCHNIPYESTKNKIEEWIIKFHDNQLERELTKALNINCSRGINEFFE